MYTNNKFELIQGYRRGFDGRLIEQRSTFLSDVDQLAVIQLAVLLVQKKLRSSEALSPTDLFVLKQKIIAAKKQPSSIHHPDGSTTELPDTDLPNTKLFRIISFDEIFESYITFTKHCNMIDQTDAMLYLTHQMSVQQNLTNKIRLDKKLLNYDDISCSPVCQQSPSNPSVLQLRRVVLAYLQLLVNSKDEIALARVIDVPTRGITHCAFTDIRILATSKSMSMFQIVSSFVRQLNLGGEGYAPSEEHSLYRHREGLKKFMEIMDKLLGALDEEPDVKSIVIRIFKQLKLALLRAKTPVYSNKIVNTVFVELMNKAKCFFETPQFTSDEENTLKLRDFLDYTNCLWGNDIGLNSSQLCGVLSTPQVNQEQLKKVSTLVTQFKTPELTDETPKKPKVKKRRSVDRSNDDNEAQKYGEYNTPLTIKNSNSKTVYDNERLHGACPHDDPSESFTDHPPLKLIRCHDVSPTMGYDMQPLKDISNCRKTYENNLPKRSQKQQLKPVLTSPRRKSNNNKTYKPKVSKKLYLPPGQKTLKQFFS